MNRGKGASDRNEWEVLLQLQKAEKRYLTSYYWNEIEVALKNAKKKKKKLTELNKALNMHIKPKYLYGTHTTRINLGYM